MLNLEVIPSGFAKRGRPDWSNIIKNSTPNGFTSITRCLFTANPVSTGKFSQQGIPRFQMFLMLLKWRGKDKSLSKNTPRLLGLLLVGITFSIMTLVLCLTSSF